MNLKLKQPTIADNLLRMRQHIQQRIQPAALNYDITANNTLYIELHDDEREIGGKYVLGQFRDSEFTDQITWTLVAHWLEGRSE